MLAAARWSIRDAVGKFTYYCVGVPVVEGSSSQDDGVVVGPFRGVAPGVLQGIPEVAPGRVAHDSLRKAPPHQEGKVHLQVQTWNT